MKNKLSALALLTVAALSLAPQPARASDEGLAFVGGFLSGVVVGAAAALNNNQFYACPPPVPVVAPVGCAYTDYSRCEPEVSAQVWIPGFWVQALDYNGCVIRRYVGGHFACRSNRACAAQERAGRRDRNDRPRRDENTRHRDRH